MIVVSIGRNSNNDGRPFPDKSHNLPLDEPFFDVPSSLAVEI